jgi:hypothetical protein
MSDIVINNEPSDAVYVDREASLVDIQDAKNDTLKYRNEALSAKSSSEQIYSDIQAIENNVDGLVTDALGAKGDAEQAVIDATNQVGLATAEKVASESARDLAEGYKSDAESAKNTAQGYVEATATNAGIASGKADIATTKASEASLSESNALAYRNEAYSHREACSQLLASFNGVYYGALNNIEAPTNLQGDDGDLYYNTDMNSLMLKDNGIWDVAVPNISDIYTKAETDVLLSNIPTNTAEYTNKTIDDYTNIVKANAVHARVKNQSGVTMTKGTVVAYFGYSDSEDAIKVVKANNTTGVSIGILQDDILADDFGMMISTGIIDGLDTSSYTNGTILYADTTGGLTDVEPTTGFAQPIAYVLKSNENIGVLQVLASYPKQDANDVRYDSTNSVYNMILNIGTQSDFEGALI